MKILESLKPFKNQRVIDLVEEAGLDVSPWSNTTGPAASNPAYCYEWSFVQPGQVVVLNIWHEAIKERNSTVWADLNMRERSALGSTSSTLGPVQRGANSKRSLRMDAAIREAFEQRLPVRLIIGDGVRRDIFDESSGASRMKLRLLDPVQWSVRDYDNKNGDCRLIRGTTPRFVDQYTANVPPAVVRSQVTSAVWMRSRRVRDAVLLRANGRCERCENAGFRMVGGEIYLETHHVIPLSEGL